MSYFSMFPNISYDAKGNGRETIHKDIFRRIKIKTKNQLMDFDFYDVQNGEAPEIIAHKYYGDAEYHWVVLLVNNITDRFHQWPMNTRQFLAHLAERYDNVDGVHHYEINQVSGDTSVKINIGTSNIDENGDTISSATLITNREYEEAKQDTLRRIRLLDPDYLEQFVEDFERLIAETED